VLILVGTVTVMASCVLHCQTAKVTHVVEVTPSSDVSIAIDKLTSLEIRNNAVIAISVTLDKY